MNFIKTLFPRFPKLSQSKQKESVKKTQDKIKKVSSLQLGGSLDYLFEEIKKIELMQEGRTKVAENKASFFLIFSGALLPVFIFLSGKYPSGSFNLFHNFILTVSWVLATIYLLWAIYYLFRTLSIKGYHKIYIPDILKFSDRKGRTKEGLAKKYLKNLLNDEQLRNEKFDYLNMAQAYLLRSFLALGAIIIAQTFFEVWNIAKPSFFEAWKIAKPSIYEVWELAKPLLD